MTALVKTHIVLLGDAGPTWAEVIGMAVGSSGNLTVVVGSTTYPTSGAVSLDPAISSGVGRVTVTGLTPNSRTAATVYIGATAVATVSLRTMPAAGQDFSIIASGCVDDVHTSIWAQGALRRFADACAYFGLGDQMYPESPEGGGTNSVYNETSYQQISKVVRAANPAASTGISTEKDDAYNAVARQMYRVFHRESGVVSLMHSVPFYEIDDDHDFYLGNDRAENDPGSVGVTGLNYYNVVCADTTEGAHYTALGDALKKEICLGTPANTDPEADPSWPSRPHPFWSKTIGDMEVFALNCCYARQSPNLHAPGAVLTALGALQKAWLLRRVLASSANVIVIMCPKELWSQQDGWKWATEERDEILAAFAAINKPIIWISADTHLGSVHTENDVVCITACPGGVGIKARADGLENSQEVWRDLGLKTDTDKGRYFCAGIERRASERRTRVTLYAHDGCEPWHMDWYDASAAPQYPAVTMQVQA